MSLFDSVSFTGVSKGPPPVCVWSSVNASLSFGKLGCFVFGPGSSEDSVFSLW